jgi:hypothetical protein
MRSAGHVVHFGASGKQNVIALFFKLGWDQYGFNKKRAETRYAELVFSYPVGSVGHVLHSGAPGKRNMIALFYKLEWDWYGFKKKACWDTLRRTSVFASGGICGSYSAFWCIRGEKR